MRGCAIILLSATGCAGVVGGPGHDGAPNGTDTSDTTFWTSGSDTGTDYTPGPPNVATTGSDETCLLTYGGNDRVRGPDEGLPLGNIARTIQVWVRTDKLQDQIAFSYGRPSPGQGFQIGTSDGFPILRTGSSATQQVTGSLFVADDEWHHLVGSWDGAVAFVMVDDEVVGSGPLPGDTLEGDLVAGNTPTGDLSKSWIGWLDDAKILYGARQPEDVMADPEALEVDPVNLLVWWDFEVPEGSAGPGVMVDDSSGNAHEGESAGLDTPDFPLCR